MFKILVPTDFSVSSRAGLRYALQWSTQQKLEIRFVHVFHTIRRPDWTDSTFMENIKKDALIYKNKLDLFVQSIIKAVKITPARYSSIAFYSLSADIGIMDYCREHDEMDFICISNRGAGKMNKPFGTITGNLIIRSRVPVITIPEHYRMKPVNSILYATDFSNYTGELKKVLSFARPLKAEIKILHLSTPGEIIPEEIFRNKGFEKRFHYVLDLQIRKRNISQSLLVNLQKEIFKIRPSLIIMFTDQHRNFFQKMLSPSKSEQLSFGTTCPLLSFGKQ
jgi:hypothetical protein